MNEKEICPICGEGHVTDHVDQVEAEYNGHKGNVPLHYQLCDACMSDSSGAVQMRANKRGMVAFRKLVDGLLSGAEILALRKRYGLNQQQAARLFGGGPVAFSKYENDDVAHSEAMDKLLRLVLRSEMAFKELVEQQGMATELRHAVANEDLAQEPKSVQAPASPRDSNELRSKLAERQLTPADVAAAVDWARLQSPAT
jgi:HTH-type transcriptional regulator/antitoxin MqsA